MINEQRPLWSPAWREAGRSVRSVDLSTFCLTYQPFVILSEAKDLGQGHNKLERPNTMTNNLALQKLIDDDAVGQLRRRDGLMATLGSEDGALNHSQPFFSQLEQHLLVSIRKRA